MTRQGETELDLSQISVDRDAEIPIGVQLAWALRARIRDGDLKAGQRLPGLRDLADATGVNINTVKAVYQRLQSEGLIDSQQGSGTFVGSASRHGSDIARIATGAAREAQETGVDPREVAAALYVSGGQPDAPDDQQRVRRGTLRTQIAVLERTFGELDAAHPGLLGAPSAGRGRAGPSLLGEADLEQVRSSLLRRLLLLQNAIDDSAQAEQQALAPRKKTAKPAATPEPGRELSKPARRPARRRAPSRPATAEG